MNVRLMLAIPFVLATMAAQAHAQEGDAAAGEKDFKKCKACHTIAKGEEVIVKGGKTGPNLFGIVGRAPGSVEGYKYSPSLMAYGETGAVWTEELITQFIADPKGFLKEQLGDGSAKSKMTFKLKDGADVAAYLASLAPPAEEGDGS